MRILALDAALGPCSVSLVEGDVRLAQRQSDDPRGASAALAGMVADVLAESPGGFAAVAVTVGPGSFTGVRAALALAHGLALGAGVPVVGVSSVEAFAAALPQLGGRAAWVALDTRRGRVFLGRGDRIDVTPLADLPAPGGPVLIAGDAAAEVAAALVERGVDVLLTEISRIDAYHVGRVGAQRLAGSLPPLAALPLYIEPPEARPQPALRPAPA